MEALTGEKAELETFKNDTLKTAKEKNSETEKALLADLGDDAKKSAEKMIKGFSDDPFARQEQLSGLADMLKTQAPKAPYDPQQAGGNLRASAKKLFGGEVKKD